MPVDHAAVSASCSIQIDHDLHGVSVGLFDGLIGVQVEVKRKVIGDQGTEVHLAAADQHDGLLVIHLLVHQGASPD